jgi:hypothetical protein
MSCWMCNGTGRCECLICHGPCEACAGRARAEKILDLAERLRLDPQDVLNYAIHHDGPKRYRRLKLPPGVAA